MTVIAQYKSVERESPFGSREGLGLLPTAFEIRVYSHKFSQAATNESRTQRFSDEELLLNQEQQDPFYLGR